MSVDSSDKDLTNGRWSKQEHKKFIQGLGLYGKNWKKIQSLVVTRNGAQIRSHAQKFFMKIQGKKSSFLDSNCENHEPFQEGECVSKKEKKRKNSAKKLPRPNSPLFWFTVSQMVMDPSFNLWDFIDQPREQIRMGQRMKDSTRTKDSIDEGEALGNITEKISSFKNSSSGFYFHIPSALAIEL